jgi:hypothetical protein
MTCLMSESKRAFMAASGAQLLSQAMPAIRDMGRLFEKDRFGVIETQHGVDITFGHVVLEKTTDIFWTLCRHCAASIRSEGRVREEGGPMAAAQWRTSASPEEDFEISRCAVYCTSLRVLDDPHRSREHVHGNRTRSFGVCPTFTDKD